MGWFWLAVWLTFGYLVGGTTSQYREKNISSADSDAVQALLARYLQRRLQGNGLSTPPPPSVLFSPTKRASPPRAYNSGEELSNERRDSREDYDDYADDLQGFEDSERGRTRIDLFAGDVTLLSSILDAVLPFFPIITASAFGIFTGSSFIVISLVLFGSSD